MKFFTAVAFVLIVSSPAPATVATDVYLADGSSPLMLRDPNVPHIYRDIMVGTKLGVVLSSGSRRTITGTIAMSWPDWAKGRLTTCDYNDVVASWDGACLKSAGLNAIVQSFSHPDSTGYYFTTGTSLVRPGALFAWDYSANAAGTAQIVATEILPSYTETPSPDCVIVTLTLNHVPSRDFNGDTIVNLKDFALFANYWRTGPESDCNSVPCRFDLDADGRAGVAELSLFGAFWLERTDVNTPLADPNACESHPQGTPDNKATRPD